MINSILKAKQEHLNAVESLFTDCEDAIITTAKVCSEALKNGNKLIFAGNGGSSCDAMHIAGEFVGRFIGERPSLPAISLTADSCALTAIGNDYGYDQVFARQLEGLGQAGDVFIGITTSGNSENIIQALKVCENKGVTSIAVLGKDGGKMLGLCDHELVVRHKETARVQECHIIYLHILCDLIEKELGLSN